MSFGICIIAHAPLASALKTCCQHIFSATPDSTADAVACVDIPSETSADEGYELARQVMEPLLENEGVLIFTDLLGATPSNIAHRFLDNEKVRIVTGVNLPGVITALSAPPDLPLKRVVLLAEGGTHSGVSTAEGHTSCE